MIRTRVRWGRILVVGVVMVLSVVLLARAGGASGSGSPRAAARRVYVVEAGDTVWSIARSLRPAGDPRPVVDALVARNHLDGAVIVPGQRLVVPEP